MKNKSQVSFVQSKMAGRQLSQHVKDVSISALLDRDLPIATQMLFEVYPDVQLNTTTTRALYTLTISSLRCLNHVGNTLHHLWLPRCSRMFPSSSTFGILYSGAAVTSATWPTPSPVPSTGSWLSV